MNLKQRYKYLDLIYSVLLPSIGGGGVVGGGGGVVGMSI